jgi:glycerol-3-phosphate acyltransferase PlsX
VIRIVLDVDGGDHGPRANLEGALLAVQQGQLTREQVILVGNGQALEAEFARLGADAAGFEVVDAPDSLDAHDSPVEAMRKKPRNSIALGIGLLKEGRAQAFVSAGSTGLVVASATVMLRCLEGVRRPGIAVTIRGEKGPFTLIDVGANPQPKAVHLLHYAIMGAAYARDSLGIPEPRVGLMNIGSEDQKGHPLVREARDLLRSASANFRFVGNVEGVDVFAGACDVIVSDGFTGNVLLKVSEGCAEYLLRALGHSMLEEHVPDDLRARILKRLARDVDYSEYGGALLLGVEGIVTICHGRSTGRAIANALGVAARAVGARVNDHIIAAARSVALPN